MLYKYNEVDIRDGMIDEDGEVSLDATVFVSEGGKFKGTVSGHGTLIIRGGEADVVIGRYGTVLSHGGTLHAVVQKDGTLHVHEGRVTIKEEGGFVNANTATAFVEYEPSEIRNMIFDRYTSIHAGTKAVNCIVTTTSITTVYPGGMFIGNKKFAIIRGQLNNSGTMTNILIDTTGKVTCVDSAILTRCVIDNGANLIVASSHGVNGIIAKNGTIDVKEDAQATMITLERKGILKMTYNSYVTYRDHGGHIIRHGGKLIRIKPKTKEV